MRFTLWKWILRVLIEQLIARLDKRKGGRYLLLDATVDATCWEWGKIKFHFLTLSVVYEGVSIPVFFINLAKKGTSHSRERKRFLQMANLLYPVKGMTLLADREYVGRDWFKFLI